MPDQNISVLKYSMSKLKQSHQNLITSIVCCITNLYQLQ